MPAMKNRAKQKHDLLHQYYKKFNATKVPTLPTNRSQQTTATLRIGQQTYNGRSGEGSHAELNAVAKAINDGKVLPHNNAKITVPGKPCCYKCSIILGLLGIKPTNGTTKCRYKMEMTQYGIPLVVRRLLITELNNDPNFPNMNLNNDTILEVFDF